jgi:hypothetical protein
VGYRPKSRRQALLHELCAKHGYCSTGLTVDDLTENLSADEIADLVIRRDGLDPVLDSSHRDDVAQIVRDWLFDPNGRGARSRLLH